MQKARRGIRRVEVRDRHRRVSTAELQVRFCRMTVLPPIGTQKRCPALSLTTIHAQETASPKDREPIDRKRLSDLPARGMRAAVERLDWYALRWKIETFHKILKSGCRAEEAQLRTAQRLTNLPAIYCVLSWRLFWLCVRNRASPQAPAHRAFTQTELERLDRLVQGPPPSTTKPLSRYVQSVA